MQHPGARQDGVDYFDDVLNSDGTDGHGGGVLDSLGLKDYDNIDTVVAPQGADVRLSCWGCNRPVKVTLEWPELIAVGMNQPGRPPVLPPGWRYSPNNQTAFVSLGCQRCGNKEGISVHMTPEEAKQHVSRGVNAGFVSPQMISQVQQQMAPMLRR